MAEAREAPRKTTTYKQFDGMNSQDERFGCEDNEFFWLENIMRVGDGKLKSVPGPGPVVAFFVGEGFLLMDTFDFVLRDDNNSKILLNG